MSVLDMVASERDWPRLLDALDAELPAYRGVWTAVDAIVAYGEDRDRLLGQVVDDRDRLLGQVAELRDRLERLERLCALCGVVAKMDRPDRAITADLAREASEASEAAEYAADVDK